MSDRQNYILGTDAAEIERLRFQHDVWIAASMAIWQRSGFGAGDRVLDLGCGPGFTSLALASMVGPGGHVLARDQSEGFLAFLDAECARRGIANVQASLGPVEELDLPAGELDGVYSRWLFCWLPDPEAVLGCVARGVRSGGTIALQEYVDWGAMAMLPPSDTFDGAVAACMDSWHGGAGTIDVGAHLPSMAEACGLRVESVRPVSRIGAVGSLEWRWLEQFLWSYLPKLVDSGSYPEAEWAAFRDEWLARASSAASHVKTPTMADIVLRKN
ncbi:MAG: SAM-dependent methyltransferase [Chlamydiales bacterium]|jgi:SAM-dependent methyltransferase